MGSLILPEDVIAAVEAAAGRQGLVIPAAGVSARTVRDLVRTGLVEAFPWGPGGVRPLSWGLRLTPEGWALVDSDLRVDTRVSSD